MNAYVAAILQGALLTVAVSVSALLVSIVLGLLGAGAKLSGRPVWVALATLYTTVIRGIPELVLMLLIFYGGTMGLNHTLEWMGSEATVDINPFVAGVLTIGFIYGAYMTETFRGAMLSIPKGQTFLRITAPQMVRYALPGFTNNWLVLIKATALVSLIGLQEMTYAAKQASAATRSPFVYFLFTAGLFLLYTTVSLAALRRLNARFSLGTRHAKL